MNAKSAICTFILILGGFQGTASAYVGTPSLEPLNPVAREIIRVSVPIGDCDGYFVTDNPPPVVRNGQSIRVDITTREIGTCVFPRGNWSFPVGSYEVGNYEIEVYRTHIPIFSGSPPVTTLIATFSVSVASGPQPQVPVPIGGAFWIALLVVTVGAMAQTHWRKISSIAVVVLLVTAPLIEFADARGVVGQGHDSTIYLLVAPSSRSLPDDVIAYVNTGVGEAPIQALRQYPPSSATYLLRNRASARLRDFLEENPTSPRAMMERYIILQYSEDSQTDDAVFALRSDHEVIAAYKAMLVPDDPFKLRNFEGTHTSTKGENATAVAPTQYGRIQMKIDEAWDRTGGHAVIGIIDNGLEVAHPSLRQFASGFYQGGNFMWGVDIGGSPADIYDVDERNLQPGFPMGVCNPQGLPLQSASVAGHGTHVAGLVAANSNVSPDAKGTCKNCGLISYKMTHNECYVDQNSGLPVIYPNWTENDLTNAMNLSTETGAQIVSMSLGTLGNQKTAVCAIGSFFYNYPMCVQARWFGITGTVAVAASGNKRIKIELPAETDEIVAVGGVDATRQMWDQYPGATCGDYFHCGSSYTITAGGPRQEVVAAAEDVYSTSYRNFDWNTAYLCGDSFGTPLGDGYGLCTGTSMSTPQVAGVFGILRSANPLLLPRTPEIVPPALIGLRAVVALTADRAQVSLPWDSKEGYGVPDAEDAVDVVLGKSKGAVVRNRATPLFRMYSSIGNDYADFVAPQTAWAFDINSLNNYAPSGSFIPSYYGHPVSTWRVWPGAGAFVLTTERSPFPEETSVSLVPIYSISRERDWPIGCVGTGCNVANRDFTLVTTVTDIEQTHADGYSLGNIQGYIFAPCAVNGKEELCKPKGTENFYRACNFS